MPDIQPLRLFEGVGIEIEYMIVDAASLDVRPYTDRLLRPDTVSPVQSREDGPISWSNELAMHVLELKTTRPVTSIPAQAGAFRQSLANVQSELAPLQARLMPTAMHPWMDPWREFERWPHGDREIYAAFDRIFDCRGHGWANLQSMHINLPFQGDAELARLHAAIRVLLPLLPGLAASSPIMDGRHTAWLDNRMEVYRHNCRRLPSITGKIIPEVIHSHDEYHSRILLPIYDEIRAHDPEGVLSHEWLNARGAIARFDRSSIEIRVMDTQECLRADLALAELAVSTARSLVEEDWSSAARQNLWSVNSLAGLLDQCLRHAEQAEIHESAYLKLFGFTRSNHCRVQRLWEQLANEATARGRLSADAGQVIEHYLRHGTLARRIRRALHADAQPAALRTVYATLCDCLTTDQLFSP